MKTFLSGAFLAAVLASGCLPDYKGTFLDPEHAATAPEIANTPSRPAEPVTAEQVNEKNAAEKARGLADEIKREENADRIKNGEMTDKPKLAIP
jgi:hypothetical protein